MFRKTLQYLGLSEPTVETNTPNKTATETKTRNRHHAEDIMNEIVTLHPKQYSDAKNISDNYRVGIPVIINMQQLTSNDAKRTLDFISGLAQGLYGKVERISSRVFLLTPHNVETTGDSPADTAEIDTQFFTTK